MTDLLIGAFLLLGIVLTSLVGVWLSKRRLWVYEQVRGRQPPATLGRLSRSGERGGAVGGAWGSKGACTLARIRGRLRTMKRIKISVVAVCLVLVCGSVVTAQTVDTYQLRYFAPGAAEPFQVGDAFPAAAALCNQADPGPLSTINPTRVVWDDAAHPGRVCTYVVPSTGLLPALPVGNYEGTLLAVNAAGSAESARSPFTRLAPPPVPSGLRFVR